MLRTAAKSDKCHELTTRSLFVSPRNVVVLKGGHVLSVAGRRHIPPPKKDGDGVGEGRDGGAAWGRWRCRRELAWRRRWGVTRPLKYVTYYA